MGTIPGGGRKKNELENEMKCEKKFKKVVWVVWDDGQGRKN